VSDAKPSERPKSARVRVTRKTRGYPFGVCEFHPAEAEALVKAGVASYEK
jgi:hypothetical protein